VAEDSAGSAEEDGAHAVAPDRQALMADGVDTAMDAM
jgi:hypothetical protein